MSTSSGPLQLQMILELVMSLDYSKRLAAIAWMVKATSLEVQAILLYTSH